MSYSRPLGPLGIDPLYFSLALFGLLFLFVLYLLLPKGLRTHYFHAYPKRYTWSAKPRRNRRSTSNGSAPGAGPMIYGRSSQASTMSGGSYSTTSRRGGPSLDSTNNPIPGGPMEETVTFGPNKRIGVGAGGIGVGVGVEGGMGATIHSGGPPGSSSMSMDQFNDEAMISSAMTKLRDPGVLIVAHGSRGKPKSVRLRLTEQDITWRTETRKKNATGKFTSDIKLGKLHSVSLANIMYVDVGKQTTALRRVENAAVPESLCFSLLTKEGSLDLEANSPRERDALVSCFSLVLDEVHAQNWRDIYRGNSADMPSSFDEYDEEHQHIHA